VLTAIDPQLNFVAVEAHWYAPKDIPVRTPCTVSWNGLLQVLASGTYEFETIVGLSDSVKSCTLASVRFALRDARDRLLYDSGVVDIHTSPQIVRVPVHGTPAITLIVTDAGAGFDCAHANWGEPSFIIQ
jgi:hypothetical protein